MGTPSNPTNVSCVRSSTPRSTPRLCQECRKEPFQYQCPRCSFRSCSLACCQAHKERTRCNGKRDLTAYVPLEAMTDQHLRSDYHFLENIVGNALETTQRRFGPKNKNKRHRMGGADPQPIHPLLLAQTTATHMIKIPQQQQQHSKLQSQARKMGVHVIILPPFMERHQQNRTIVQNKNNTLRIQWTVEWCMHSFKTVEDTTTDDTQQEQQQPVSSTSTTQRTVVVQQLWDTARLRDHMPTTPDDVVLRLRHAPSRADQPRYYAVDPSQSLGEALRGHALVEFPTLHMVPLTMASLFPLVMETVAAAADGTTTTTVAESG